MVDNVRKASFAVRNHSVVHSTAKIDLGERLKAASNMENNEDSMVRLPRLVGVLSQDNLHH